MASLVLLLLAGCGGSSSASGQAAPSKAATEHDLTVEFTLHDTDNGVYCDTGGRGGYSDIGPGSAVTILNGSNEVIAAGQLGNGCVQPDGTNQIAMWTAHVKHVPDAAFYQVEVSHRGRLTVSRSEMAAKNWTVTASLGG